MRGMLDAIRQAITITTALALITAIWLCDTIEHHTTRKEDR